MKGTDYAGKKVFVANFFKSFRTILSSANRQLIVEFAKCNFDDIYNHVEAEREKKKSLTSEVSPPSLPPVSSAPPHSLGHRRRRSSRLTGMRQSCRTPRAP